MLQKISNRLGVEALYLKELSESSDRQYRCFKINKKRIINAPRVHLKKVQKEIQHLLEEVHTPSEVVHGFVKGKSFITNAQTHLGAKYLLCLDIKDFFPSINFLTIDKMFRDYGCSFEDARILSGLVTYKRILPQGSPASPIIANIVFHEFDLLIQDFCLEHNIKYTRYADDLTFSSEQDNLNQPQVFVNDLFKNRRFRISHGKTKFSSYYNRQEVTGLVINENRLNLNRKWRRESRSLFYKANQKPFRYAMDYPMIQGRYNLLNQIKNANKQKDPNAGLILMGEKAMMKTRYLYKLRKFFHK